MKRMLAVLLVMLLPWAAEASEPFAVAARGAVLIDADSGRVLFGQNENAMLPMASTTKVMTTLIALEHSSLDEPVTAGKHAAGVTGTSLYLSEGETLSMEHMLYGLMLRSGNDAAVAVAEHVAGSVEAFAELMNEKARALDADAWFVNPHGLDADGHAISALGLARVMRAAMQNPTFRTITATKRKVIPWVGNEYSRVLENKNRLLTTYEGATGGKTGYTSKAGRCLVFSAERNGLSLIGVVLNCPTWFDTATAMLDYGFESFRTERVAEAGEALARLPVVNGIEAEVAVAAAEPLRAAVPVGSRTETRVNLPPSLDAPVRSGDVVGSVQLVSDGIVVAQRELRAAGSVERRDLRRAFLTLIHRWTLRR